jgi:hypothetical protein
MKSLTWTQGSNYSPSLTDGILRYNIKYFYDTLHCTISPGIETKRKNHESLLFYVDQESQGQE